jgi:phage baseplate assembly protein gpV
MPYTIYESGPEQPKTDSTSIAPGIVMNNCDLIMQGKVQVRIPSMGLDVWARVVSQGAGMGRGEVAVPKIRDEVLVAFNADDPRDAFILGGLYSNINRLPILLPTDPQTKRIIRTGMTPALGHEVEFDDVLQTITIKAALGQKIELSPIGVKIEANATTTIEMTAPPKVGPGILTITMGANKLTMSPKGVEITGAPLLTLSATSIDLNAANVSIKGVKVSLNS